LLDFGIWVQFEQSGVVLEWVLLLVGVLEGGLFGVSDDGLDLIGVDDSGQIGVAHAGSVEGVSGFLGSGIFEGSEALQLSHTMTGTRQSLLKHLKPPR